MLERLREIYPSLTTDYDPETKNDYHWYVTETNEIFGIKKAELTDKDNRLLTVLFTPYEINLPPQTKIEQEWKHYIKNNLPLPAREKAVRFVYFSFTPNKLKPKAFKDAIQTIFATHIPILWENEHSGLMVEEQTIEETISYEQIVDVLMSDLYVKIKFFVGPYLSEMNDTGAYYTALRQYAKSAFSCAEKAVISYTEAIPLLLIDQLKPNLLIPELVLQEVYGDDELLNTINTFIDCNLNTSVAAKVLFMHRNSLQYRIDKFIEKTGIDIRDFKQAMTVKLAIIMKNRFD